MKRLFLFSALIAATLFAAAQHPMEYSADDSPLRTGLELYRQQQYAAAADWFSAFLTNHPQACLTGRQATATEADEAEFYLLAADFHRRRTDVLERLEQYIERHPYSNRASELRLMAGTLLVEGRKAKAGLTHLEAAMPRQLSEEQQAELCYYKGLAYSQTGRHAQAAECFRQLLGRPPYVNQAKYYYAYSLYAQGKLDEALPYMLEIEHLPVWRDHVPYYLCQIYYQQGNYEEVIDRGSALLAQKRGGKNDAELCRIMGEVYYSRGRYDLSVYHLQKYEEQTKQVSRNDMYLLGMALYQTGEYSKAVRYLSRVTTTDDALTQNAYLNLGHCYLQLGDKNNARMAYGAAARTTHDATTHEEALYSYALTTCETTDALGEAATALTDYLNEFPDSRHAAEAYALLGDVLLTTKNTQSALKALSRLKRSDQLESTRLCLTYRLGTEQYQSGQLTDAARSFTEVIDGGSAKYASESRYWRGETYYRMGRYKESAADFEAFLSGSQAAASPNYNQASYSAGYAWFSQKQYSKALQHFLKYTDNSSNATQANYPDALNREGDCYYSLRNLGRAESCYNKVIALGRGGEDYATFQRGYVLGLTGKLDDKISVMERLVKQHPQSGYADDALYEVARAQLLKQDDRKAIEAYRRLLSNYPNSNLTAKAALEIGMIYANNRQFDDAVKAYKQVIANYPGTEESYTALEGIEQAYVETDRIREYIDYTKTLGRVIKTDAATREDSLTYVAAERQYIAGNYAQAAKGMGTYLERYCAGGRYCTMARYYQADSYYRQGLRAEALEAFAPLTDLQGSQYREEACLRCSEICYDNKDYARALQYFQKLRSAANSIDNIQAAQLGVLRCNYLQADYDATIQTANEIVGDTQQESPLTTEARYCRAKAYLAKGNLTIPQNDLKILSADLRTSMGAEAKYLLADCLFQLEQLDGAEQVVMQFAEQNTPHQYWLARSLVLLADIYMKRGDDFQAKQYLLSIKSNYPAGDDIHTLADERLSLIAEREQERVY